MQKKSKDLQKTALDESKLQNEDKHNFIQSILSNLFIFNCSDAVEFNLSIRSLNKFLKVNKSVGLVILDGLHHIENLE